MIIPYLVAIERRIHLFSFRTQKLSFSSSKILGWQRSGKIEHCQITTSKQPQKGCFFNFNLAVFSLPGREDIAKSKTYAWRCGQALMNTARKKAHPCGCVFCYLAVFKAAKQSSLILYCLSLFFVIIVLRRLIFLFQLYQYI